MNPGSAGAGYGYADMGPYEGGQAEYLRVPYADFNCLKLPEDAEEKEQDYVTARGRWGSWRRIRPCCAARVR